MSEPAECLKLLKKLIFTLLVVAIVSLGGIALWSQQAILPAGQPPVDFAITPGSGVHGAIGQMARQGVPVNPLLLELLTRVSGKSGRLKAGNYQLKAGTTPLRLIRQLVRGEFAQESLVVIEGWTFRQMRQAVALNPSLKHDTAALSDIELLAKISTDFTLPEGLFFPDTYQFGKGVSELKIYRQAHAAMLKRLADGWQARDMSVPYKTPYEALTMASIIEKETGKKGERGMIAGVFVNRLKAGMLLQTDPTVIYGMGERYQGTIHKRDLETDTPYNTYTRPGLPPSPIALPGKAALHAALNPDKTDSLYFVARGDGSSAFSTNLPDHNRAVEKYQRPSSQ